MSKPAKTETTRKITKSLQRQLDRKLTSDEIKGLATKTEPKTLRTLSSASSPLSRRARPLSPGRRPSEKAEVDQADVRNGSGRSDPATTARRTTPPSSRASTLGFVKHETKEGEPNQVHDHGERTQGDSEVSPSQTKDLDRDRPGVVAFR